MTPTPEITTALAEINSTLLAIKGGIYILIGCVVGLAIDLFRSRQ